MQYQLLGWGPDLDPTTPGVLVDVHNVIPTTDGYKAMPPLTSSLSLIGYSRAIAMTRLGSAQDLYYLVHSSDSTVSTATLGRITTGNVDQTLHIYTSSSYTVPVVMRPFDGELFVARSGAPMVSTGGATTTAVTNAPSCSLLETTKDFVIAFDTAAGYDWHCSAVGDGHDWALSVSTQCVRGEFFDKQGAIVAAGRQGENLVAFTETQMWVGRYVGAPDVWQWEHVSRDIGCVGPEGAVETPYGLCWVGRNDIYIYNGANVAELNTAPVRSTLFSLVNLNLIKHTQVAWDRKRGLLWVLFASQSQTSYTVRDLAFVYHFDSKRWSRAALGNVQAINQLPTHDYGEGSTNAWSALRNLDDMMLTTRDVGTSNVKRHDDTQQTAASGYVVTGYVGDLNTVTMLRAVRPRFSAKNDENAALVVETRLKAAQGGATATQTATLDADFKYPLRVTGRFHSAALSLKGRDVVNGIDFDLVPVGNR